MQKRPATEVHAAGHSARCHDERTVACQSPLRTNLRPVCGALSDFAVKSIRIVKGRLIFQAQIRGALTLCQQSRIFQPLADVLWQLSKTVDVVGRGIVQRRIKVGGIRNPLPTLCQRLPDRLIIQQLCHNLHIDRPGLSATGTTVQTRRMWVVRRMTAMANQHDRTRKAAQAQSFEHLARYIGFLRNGQRSLALIQVPMTRRRQVIHRMIIALPTKRPL